MEYSKSVVLRGKENFTIEDVPLPTLTDSDIEINVSACGVCGSDVHMWKAGKSWAADIDPFVMGHEFCGVVTNPNQSSFKVGDGLYFGPIYTVQAVTIVVKVWNICVQMLMEENILALYVTEATVKSL